MLLDKILLIFLYKFNPTPYPFPADKYLMNYTQITLRKACKLFDTVVRC